MRSNSRGRAYMASPHSCTGLRQPRAPSDRVWLGRGDRDQEGYDFLLQLLGTMRTAQLLLKADGVRHAHARQETPALARRYRKSSRKEVSDSNDRNRRLQASV